MRNRKGAHSSGVAKDGWEEVRDEQAPLIARDTGSGARAAPPPAPRGCWSRRLITYHDVSPSAARAARELVAVLSEPCSQGDPRVNTFLERVWSGAGLGAAAPPIPDESWKRLGFQGVNPMTDVRGARIAGLEYMARLLEEAPQSRALATNDGFPFGIACLNILFLLECHLRLGQSELPSYCPCCGVGVRAEYTVAQPHRGKHIRGFGRLLENDYDALFGVYVGAVLFCARLWEAAASVSLAHGDTTVFTNPLSGAASDTRPAADTRLMKFPVMLRMTKDAVLSVLAGAPNSSRDVQVQLARLANSTKML